MSAKRIRWQVFADVAGRKTELGIVHACDASEAWRAAMDAYPNCHLSHTVNLEPIGTGSIDEDDEPQAEITESGGA